MRNSSLQNYVFKGFISFLRWCRTRCQLVEKDSREQGHASRFRNLKELYLNKQTFTSVRWTLHLAFLLVVEAVPWHSVIFFAAALVWDNLLPHGCYRAGQRIQQVKNNHANKTNLYWVKYNSNCYHCQENTAESLTGTAPELNFLWSS